MSTSLPEVVSRYFEFDAVRDVESIVALFAAEATRIATSSTAVSPATSRAARSA